MNAPMLWHLHANAVLCDTVNETDDQRAYVAAHEAVLISWLQELHNYKSSVILEREVGMDDVMDNTRASLLRLSFSRLLYGIN